MRRFVQALLLVLCGLGLLQVSLFTELYLRYVKEGMRPLLIASGAVLLLLGLASAVLDKRQEKEGEGHGHDHSGLPRVAWLLLLPALSLLCYAPPALGAYTASRQPPKAVAEQSDFDPLPATSPVPMTLSDFTSRVRQDRRQDIKGRGIRMTGFVTPGGPAGSWDLTRVILNCCAADAQSVKVRIHGGPALPANTWVTVTGTWHAAGKLGTGSAAVALDARTVQKVARPVNGYQDALPLP
ncbi:putative repeat protein (TIGR03943 family) [Streptomyces griseochromogenes]|uniref:Repeat protein (TIGR03943 family) n=1 Tax=Streptomyces griseochromogenes TaxID=68214 RepID=A0A1B1B8Z7_9ACTN|nr:TIGR03943 family protein [Streptomyces griseochromogenes]ANP55306.1 TIGR03943 family protein [Streptomyces griseochromogenes]MBP2050243.1 putative repeat protein (TIGR03943 family) [Streptomyces griseochromogenes]